jgi:hypothetical protein
MIETQIETEEEVLEERKEADDYFLYENISCLCWIAIR